MTRRPYTAALTFLLFLACRDERAPHTFHAPAPTPVAAPVVAPSPIVPDVPFGSTGADARITGVVDAATGAPVAYTDIRDSVVILALFARGPAWTAKEAFEVQLVLRGACEAVVTASFPAPAPVVIAYQFHVSANGAGVACARDGDVSAHVQIVGSNSRALAASIPLRLVIRRSR